MILHFVLARAGGKFFYFTKQLLQVVQQFCSGDRVFFLLADGFL
jgi:hypothetical protein